MSWSAVRTVAVLELRQRVRSTRWQVMLVVWGVVLVLLCGGLTALAGMTGSEAEDTAPILYDLTVCFVLGIGLIIAPTLSATSVNGDRADATLALLQATRLRSQEIVVGKLVAAWSAALAFLAVALPFLLVFTLLGGAAWMTLAGHLLILVVTLGAVCAIGLGFSAATARTSASAVLTYLVVAGLVIGSPIVTAIGDGGPGEADGDHLRDGLQRLDERQGGLRDRAPRPHQQCCARRADLVDAHPRPLRGAGRRLGAEHGVRQAVLDPGVRQLLALRGG